MINRLFEDSKAKKKNFSLFSDKFIAHKNPVNHDFCPNSPHSIFGINFCPGGKQASEKKIVGKE